MALKFKCTRKSLTLAERMDVIRQGESGKSSRELALNFGVGRTQIQSILKRKAEILTEFKTAVSLTKKRNCKTTGFEPINELCHKWFLEALDRKINVTGPMLKEKGLQFAKELNLPSFAASNGWLHCFIKRNKLAFRKLCDVSDDVNTDICSEWINKLPYITAGYEARDIFNMDETGLFFKVSADESSFVTGQRCNKGERSNDRLTICLCANLAGDKDQVLVIGKSASPRSFGHIDSKSLPISYTHSPKAWMTTKIFTSWLNRFNDNMMAQGRHILLFLDNAPSHPHLSLSNIKLVFFPPNTMSILQPMDQGVIQMFKLLYRKAQFRFVMSEIETDTDKLNTVTELLNKMNVLNAVYLVASAWKEVEPSTIRKGFIKAGFFSTIEFDTTENDQADSMLESVPPTISEKSIDLLIDQMLDFGNELFTCDTETVDWKKPAAELLDALNGMKTEVEDESDNDNDVTDSDSLISKQKAFNSLRTLRNFLQQNCLLDGVEHLAKVEDVLLDSVPSKINSKSYTSSSNEPESIKREK